MRQLRRAASFLILSMMARPSAIAGAIIDLSDCQIPAEDRCGAGCRRTPRMNLLVSRLLDDLYWVDFLFTLEGPKQFLAGVSPGGQLLATPHSDGRGIGQGARIQCATLLFPGHRPVHAGSSFYARGIADLDALDGLVSAGNGYVYGAEATSIDAGIYGFIANIYFYDIDTPLKRFVAAQGNLVRHCVAIHHAVMRA